MIHLKAIFGTGSVHKLLNAARLEDLINMPSRIMAAKTWYSEQFVVQKTCSQTSAAEAGAAIAHPKLNDAMELG